MRYRALLISGFCCLPFPGVGVRVLRAYARETWMVIVEMDGRSRGFRAIVGVAFVRLTERARREMVRYALARRSGHCHGVHDRLSVVVGVSLPQKRRSGNCAAVTAAVRAHAFPVKRVPASGAAAPAEMSVFFPRCLFYAQSVVLAFLFLWRTRMF